MLKINREEDVVLLEERVENFLDWYELNFKKTYTLIGEYATREELANLLQKTAVWYELRYPDYEIENHIPSVVGDVNYSSTILSENQEINKVKNFFSSEEQVVISNFLDLLNWEEFYSARTFIRSLPFKEFLFFGKVKYPNILYLDNFNTLKLSRKGRILETSFKKDKQNLTPIVMHKFLSEIKDVLFENFDCIEEIEEAISLYEKTVKLKQLFLETVLVTIILRGGNQIGPRRGMMLATEFKLDLSLPMIYGIDKSDPFLNGFISHYLSLGGEKDIIFYEDYFKKKKKSPKRLLKKIAGK